MSAASDPFQTTVNPDHYVPRSATEAVLEAMERSIRDGGHPVALSGPAGLGKTLMLHQLARRLADRFHVVYVPYCNLPFRELCTWVLEKLGDEVDEDPQGEMLDRAFRLAAEGTELLLLIDDASAMPTATARSLAALVEASAGALRVAMAAVDDSRVGAALAAMGSELEELRLADEMDESETAEYVGAYLQRQSLPTDVSARFGGPIVSQIHLASQGIPRRVNELGTLLVRSEGDPADLISHWMNEEAGQESPPERLLADRDLGTASAPQPTPEPLRPLASPPAAAPTPSEVPTLAKPKPAAAPKPLPPLPEPELDAVPDDDVGEFEQPLPPATHQPEVTLRPRQRIFSRRRSSLPPGLVVAGVLVLAAALAGPYLAERFSNLDVQSLPELPELPDWEELRASLPLGDSDETATEPGEPAPLPEAAESQVDTEPARSEPLIVPIPELDRPPAAPEPRTELQRLADGPTATQQAGRPAIELPPVVEVEAEVSPAEVLEEVAPQPAAPEVELARVAPEPVVEAPEPAPIEEPAPEPIPVNVNAIPWAVIQIDGEEVGETPLAGVPLSPGEHRFRAELPGGRVVEQTVDIGPDNRHVSFE